VTITFAQPGSANAATQNTLIPEGSDIYRIAPDGSPEKLATLKGRCGIRAGGPQWQPAGGNRQSRAGISRGNRGRRTFPGG
jgi:hypothetical protein